MEIKTITVGEMRANCYLFYNPQTLECAIIDPGDEADFITEEILRLQLKPQFILLTHGHYDHCLACLELKLNFNLPIYLDPQDDFLYQKAAKSAAHWSSSQSFKQPPAADFPSVIKLGDQTIKVIPTPGHTPGSVSLYAKPFLFTGDTLFADAVGRTDLSYSSHSDLLKSLKKISVLPFDTEIFPGHGDSVSLESALSPSLD